MIGIQSLRQVRRRSRDCWNRGYQAASSKSEPQSTLGALESIEESLSKWRLFGERSLRHVLSEYEQRPVSGISLRQSPGAEETMRALRGIGRLDHRDSDGARGGCLQQLPVDQIRAGLDLVGRVRLARERESWPAALETRGRPHQTGLGADRRGACSCDRKIVTVKGGDALERLGAGRAGGSGKIIGKVPRRIVVERPPLNEAANRIEGAAVADVHHVRPSDRGLILNG